MADYDSALPVRGNVLDGDSIYADNTILIAGGSDGTSYQQLNVDTSGAVNVVGRVADGEIITGDPLTTGALFETGGGIAVDSGDITYVASDAYGRIIVVGQTADGSAYDTNVYPVVTAGVDDSGDVQVLRTDVSGALYVNIGGALQSSNAYASTNLVKDTPTAVVTLSPATTTTIRRIDVSGSGLMKCQIYFGTTSSEVVFATQFNSTANPNLVFEFPEGLEVGSTETIYAECTNLERRPSPNSDFDGYGTIFYETAS